MKRICLLIMLLVSLNLNYTFAQSGKWVSLDNGLPEVNSRYEDIYFSNPDTGWVIQFEGNIYKTLDGGSTWVTQLSKSGLNLRSIVFADDNYGWAGTLTVGDILYETTNGGESWSSIHHRIPDEVPYGICGLSAPDENTIYGVGRYSGPAILIKSTDKGKTWKSIGMSKYAGSLVDVHFFNSSFGIVVGGSGVFPNTKAIVLVTNDGGNSWFVAHETERIGEWGWKIHFVNNSLGYVSIERSNGRTFYLKTTNGGTKWEEKFFKRDYDVQGIVFVNQNEGYIGGWSGPTYQTLDGGSSWGPADFGYNINRFIMFGDSLGYSIGRQVYKYHSSKITSVQDFSTSPDKIDFKLYPNYPNPFNSQTKISFSVPENTFAELSISNSIGEKLEVLVSGKISGGLNSFYWDANNLSSGIYYLTLETGKFKQTQKMILLK
ncbi:MAG: T9SS type A sorting domain-containing protein [Melioribacteraceae bacterium]|nr:T9SS type A sorting domain-containing protein [Melioribacteraceae bacterium]